MPADYHSSENTFDRNELSRSSDRDDAPNPFSTASDSEEEDVDLSRLHLRDDDQGFVVQNRPSRSGSGGGTLPDSTDPSSSNTTLTQQNKTAVSPTRSRIVPSPIPTHRASFPSPHKAPAGSMYGGHYLGDRGKDGPCCERDKEITAGAEISITDAVKMSDGGSKASYIAYVIRTGDHEARRRYSAFDSLRTALVALYPVLIVPPIPSKQSLADYAVKGGQNKARDDATVIARRIRMLEDFLRRIAKHPILSGEHVFHRFLEADVHWNEVLHSPPISLLPKNPLHAPSHNPTLQPLSTSSSGDDPSHHGPDASEDAGGSTEQGAMSTSDLGPSSSVPFIAHHLLPNPSASTPLKHPDARFMDSESFTDRFSTHLSGTMEKVNRRVVKRWGERAHGFSELGALLNGFSLDAKGGLQPALEKFGQAVDAEQMSTALLLQHWERGATEPLHVYAQYGQIIRQRLAFRHQKHVQYELVQETLDRQREKLEVLERQEREARRLEDALQSGGKGLISSQAEMEAERERERERIQAGRKKSGGSGGYGLLSAVKHSLSGMMDVDPEATRRANIGRTRDNISQLEDSLQASAQDLKYASMTLQADLDRFQRQKMVDLRNMCMALAQMHRDWAVQNLKAWEEALSAIDAIEPHPNKPQIPEGSSSSDSANPVEGRN